MKLLFSLCFFFLSFQSYALTLELSNNQTSDVEVYSGSDKPFEIIYMHGKNAKSVIPPAERLFEQLSNAGYTVYSAEMPWSRTKYKGTQETANEIIQQLTRKINSNGKKAVLVGHSMGASYAVIYSSKFGNQLAGVIPIAFAHVPQMSMRFQNETKQSVQKATKLVAAGQGSKEEEFNDLNKGESYSIDATAEYYKSFYDPNTLPDASIVIENITIPVLWISGARDRLNEIYKHEDIYASLPDNEKNAMLTIKGNHMSVLKFSSESIINWLGNLK